MSFLIPRFKDIIDILIISILIYQTLLIVRKSGGYQVLWGLLSLLALYFLASIFELKVLSSLLSGIRTYWLMAIVILFQPELRAILSRFNLAREFQSAFNRNEQQSVYTPLIDAISSMSFRKIGALVVIETKRRLPAEYIQTGEPIDSAISMRLIMAIFNLKSVLHDGAIVIRGNRIIAAKVVLPLSKNPEYVHTVGTRHLAGVGISERTDAISIIVSEQTGQISIAQEGVLKSNVAFEEMMQIISDASK